MIDHKGLVKFALGQLNRANADHKHPFRTMVVSTVDTQRGADARWVVLRKYENHRLTFYSDSRAPKVNQISMHPIGTIVFYHPKHSLQIRANVSYRIITEGDTFDKHLAKAQGRPRDYISSLPPGSHSKIPYQEGEILHFAVVEADINRYDILKIGTPHLRVEYVLENNLWMMRELTP